MADIRISTRTDGNGKDNEDSFTTIRQDERAILCVSDGVGGLDAGDIASLYITKKIEAWAEEKDVNTMGEKSTHREYSSLVARLHEDLLAISEEKDVPLGATSILAFVGLKKVVFENIGDSRAYVYQHGNCKQVTVDQTVRYYDLVTGCNYEHVRGIDMENMTEEQKDRTLMQCIGYGARIPKPMMYIVPIAENVDILLCSDGLSNTIKEYEIKRELDRERSGDKVLANLINLAKKRGETDNITAVLYRRRGRG